MNTLISEERIASHLPPYTDLAEFTSDTGPVSVVHQITPHQVLSLHGFNHYKDPDYWQFPELRNEWARFLDMSDDGAPGQRLAVIEGRSFDTLNLPQDDIKAAEDMAIRHVGESALVSLWASKENVEILRPELPTADDATKLLEKFTQEEVVTFYAIRQASQLPEIWKGGTETLPYDEYIENYLHSLQAATQATPLATYDFSYRHFTATHKEFFGVVPSEEQVHRYPEILRSFTDKDKANEPLTRTSGASNNNRDAYIGRVLTMRLVEGRSIFGAYGWYHVRRLERLLGMVASNLAVNKPLADGV
jgi:hypothetical protein